MIGNLSIRNFQCFRGEHSLALEAKVYSVFARWKDDPERSNWGGKTSLLESIRFCLYGDHRHRLDDEWISRGEAIGEVALEVPAGTVRRRRERGKRTTVYFHPRGMPASAVLIQAEAEDAIERVVVGLGREDFLATCFFPQKAMAKFIVARPDERMKVVSAWIRLGPLEACEARAKAAGASLESEAKKIEGHLAALDLREGEILRRDAAGAEHRPRAAIEDSVARLAEEAEADAGALASLDEALDRCIAGARAEASRRQFDDLVREGKALAATLAEANEPERRNAHEAAEALAAESLDAAKDARRLVRERESVARGRFDGRCPVAGIDCPATNAINSRNEEATSALVEAEKDLAAATACASKHSAAELVARARFQEAERIHVHLDALRAQAKKLRDAAKPPTGAPENASALREKIDAMRAKLSEVTASLASARALLSDLGSIAATRENLAARRKAMSGELGTIREAIAIFGKRGAQRRVAEGALGKIEESANLVLRECEANLRVEMRWSREGQGLAKACETCGNPFPSSAKAKTCDRCGAGRGPQLENKLEVILSDRSGAAEDLAGIAVQLSASRWLRASRGSTWATAMLDEPFGALDAAHRRGLSRHLATMLSRNYGIEQAFVVSHSPDTANALPGRIEIVSDGKWSTPRVVA